MTEPPLSAEMVLSGIIRTGGAASGACIQWNADWSMDAYNAAGERTAHWDPPFVDREFPWLCSGCELCDGTPESLR